MPHPLNTEDMLLVAENLLHQDPALQAHTQRCTARYHTAHLSPRSTALKHSMLRIYCAVRQPICNPSALRCMCAPCATAHLQSQRPNHLFAPCHKQKPSISRCAAPYIQHCSPIMMLRACARSTHVKRAGAPSTSSPLSSRQQGLNNAQLS